MKGLKFTPTPKSNQQEIKSDIDEFCRKLRLKEMFVGENMDPSLVRNRSGYNTNSGRDKHLDNYIKSIKSFPIKKITKVKSNLNRIEKEALER